jgi:hypothetical protein
MRKIGFWMAMTGVCVLAMMTGGCMEVSTRTCKKICLTLVGPSPFYEQLRSRLTLRA